MARRPRRNTEQVSASAGPSVGTARPAPRENAPRGTFRVASALRDFALSMPDLVKESAVNKARAKLAPSPVRPPQPVVKAKAVATVTVPNDRANKGADRRDAQPETTKREDPRVCKSRPPRNKGSGDGRPFVPWCK